MRALRVVGYDEGDAGQPVVILEDPDRRERFTVPADERLRAAARGDVQRLGQLSASSELESQLRPREIQARIRAGASVEQVAAAAGVPEQRIERFAYPVLLERSRIADLARSAHPVRQDGPDVRTLGEVVAHTFTLRGQDFDQAEWDAWRGEDHKWVVALGWRVGRSDITARWGYHPGSHGGTVTALNEHAVDLVDGEQHRPPRGVGPVIDFTKPDADESDDEQVTPAESEQATGTDRTASGRAGTGPDRTSSGRVSTGPDRTNSGRVSTGPERSGSGRVGTGPERTGSGRPGSARSNSGRSGSGRTGADQAAPSSDAGRRATKTTTGPGATSGKTGARRADGAAAKPASESTPAAKRTGGGRKAKPVMPSWEDVLLGVKSQRP